MVDKDVIVCREPHLGEFILVLGDVCTVFPYAFATLRCAFMLDDACVCVLGPRFD